VVRKSFARTSLILAVVALFLPLAGSGSPPASAQALDVLPAKTVYVAMRDGVRLETTYWLPATAGPFPTILVRTPYGDPLTAVSPNETEAKYWASRGYAFIRQFFRGTVGSEGIFTTIFDNQIDDGYDAVEWAAAQPWSTGKVGLDGCSVPGVGAQSAVISGPPHLTTAVLSDGGTNGFRDWGYQGLGVLQNTHPGYYTGLALGFTRPMDPKPGDDNFEIRQRVAEQRRIRQNQSVYSGGFPFLGNPVSTIYAHDTWDEWWQARTWYHFRDNIKVPTYHTSEWQDPVLENTARTYSEWPTSQPKKLIVADNGHCSADYHGPRERWFDYWLKGIDNGIMNEPPVLLQVMPDEKWRYEQEWPLARAVNTPLYFRGGPTQTAASLNDGAASWTMPDALEAPNPLIWDPNKPHLPGFSRLVNVPGGDQREEEVQLLTFTSPPLTDDIEVTGPITAVIYATSTATDAEWSIVITEVLPDGSSMDRTRGAGRANLRVDPSKITPVVPGEIYKLEIPIRPTSRVFKAGNRIRVDVANSDFPKFGLVMQPSNNVVYHDILHPSQVILPVVGPGGQWADTAPIPEPARR
jgi:putative CocE/NonD family hydrolase